MASSDAFVIGEDWISEHYFTADAKSQSFQAKILDRRKDWDEEITPSWTRPVSLNRGNLRHTTLFVILSSFRSELPSSGQPVC